MAILFSEPFLWSRHRRDLKGAIRSEKALALVGLRLSTAGTRLRLVAERDCSGPRRGQKQALARLLTFSALIVRARTTKVRFWAAPLPNFRFSESHSGRANRLLSEAEHGPEGPRIQRAELGALALGPGFATQSLDPTGLRAALVSDRVTSSEPAASSAEFAKQLNSSPKALCTQAVLWSTLCCLLLCGE